MHPVLSRRVSVMAMTGAMLTVLLGATPGMGADNGTVDAEVTVEAAAACLELSTSAISFGTLALGAENASGTPGITVSNCGEADATILASGSNATGTGAAWNLVDSAATCADTLGTDNYHLGLATPAGASIATLSTSNKELGVLAGAGTADHVARISTACPGSSGAGQTMSMAITYIATNVVVPPIVLEELTADQATAAAAAAFVLPASKDYDVTANCSANSVACPGGVPSNPLPQVRVQATNVNAVQVPATLRWTTTATLAVVTLQPIPVTISGVSCDVSVNSANGSVATVAGSADLNFLSYPNPAGTTNFIAVQNASITGVETADLTLTGSFTCQLADAFKSSFIPQLTDQIEAFVQGNICGAPEPAVFMACPPLP
jgi:hypothetical protein